MNSSINYPRNLSFAERLYNLVNSELYVYWSCDGDSFYIDDLEKFEQIIKCRMNNFSVLSFIRQLHIYGFKRTIDGRRTRYKFKTNFAGFYHPSFQRDHPELLCHVKRKTQSKKISDKPPSKIKNRLTRLQASVQEHLKSKLLIQASVQDNSQESIFTSSSPSIHHSLAVSDQHILPKISYSWNKSFLKTFQYNPSKNTNIDYTRIENIMNMRPLLEETGRRI